MRTVYRDWAFWVFLGLAVANLVFAVRVAEQNQQLVATVDALRQQMAVVKDQNVRLMRERNDLYENQGEVKSSLKRLEDFVEAVKARAARSEAARQKSGEQK